MTTWVCNQCSPMCELKIGGRNANIEMPDGCNFASVRNDGKKKPKWYRKC